MMPPMIPTITSIIAPIKFKILEKASATTQNNLGNIFPGHTYNVFNPLPRITDHIGNPHPCTPTQTIFEIPRKRTNASQAHEHGHHLRNIHYIPHLFFEYNHYNLHHDYRYSYHNLNRVCWHRAQSLLEIFFFFFFFSTQSLMIFGL